MTREDVFDVNPELCKLEQQLGGRIELSLAKDRRGYFPVVNLHELLARGEHFALTRIPRPGNRDECHENSVRLFRETPTLSLASGFALANDGIWYHHSWCIRRDENADAELIETTPVRFERYFGVEYRGQAAEDFAGVLMEAWGAPAIKEGSPTDLIDTGLRVMDGPDMELRFSRALQARKRLAGKEGIDPADNDGWQKWRFEATHPLLRLIQEALNGILSESFKEEDFYLDFTNADTVQAYTFPDPEGSKTVLIALTRGLVEALLSLANRLAGSTRVKEIVGVQGGPAEREELDDVLFILELLFLVSHEVGHYVLGHIVDRTVWFEFPSPAPDADRSPPRTQKEELDADAYAVEQLCQNILEGGASEALFPLPGSTYTEEQFLGALIMAVTGVFLLHLGHTSTTTDPALGEHPPLVLRQHQILRVIQHWLTKRGKDSTPITGTAHHEIMQAVGHALPEELRKKWDAQVDYFESPEGQKYLDKLLPPD